MYSISPALIFFRQTGSDWYGSRSSTPSTIARAPSSSGAVDAPVQMLIRNFSPRRLASMIRLASASGTAFGYPAPVKPLDPDGDPAGIRARLPRPSRPCRAGPCSESVRHPSLFSLPSPGTAGARRGAYVARGETGRAEPTRRADFPGPVGSPGSRVQPSSRYRCDQQYRNRDEGRASRMNPDGRAVREFLRHTVATLAYRGGKAIRGAPPSFARFRASPTTRTPGEVLAHVCDLLDWALRFCRGQHLWKDSTPQDWEAEWMSSRRSGLRCVLVRTPLSRRGREALSGTCGDVLTESARSRCSRMAGSPSGERTTSRPTSWRDRWAGTARPGSSSSRTKIPGGPASHHRFNSPEDRIRNIRRSRSTRTERLRRLRPSRRSASGSSRQGKRPGSALARRAAPVQPPEKPDGAHRDFWGLTEDGVAYASESLGLDLTPEKQGADGGLPDPRGLPDVKRVFRLEEAGPQARHPPNGEPKMLESRPERGIDTLLDTIINRALSHGSVVRGREDAGSARACGGPRRQNDVHPRQLAERLFSSGWRTFSPGASRASSGGATGYPRGTAASARTWRRPV